MEADPSPASFDNMPLARPYLITVPKRPPPTAFVESAWLNMRPNAFGTDPKFFNIMINAPAI